MKHTIKILKKMMIGLLAVVLLIVTGGAIFMNHPKFGKIPSGLRLERIKQSSNYKDGAFQNINLTPALSENKTFLSILFDFIFVKRPHKTPIDPIPCVKTDLKNIKDNSLVWFGHSSYFMKIDGLTFLVDPVLSGAASPIASTTRAFAGTDVYKPQDIPEIDYLIITHDHWDHLDYETVLALKPKVKHVICGLGVGAHLEYWGFDTNNIIEKDWNESVTLQEGFIINTRPARHFSGRGFKRNGSLWMSVVLQSPNHKIFIGGDSGYDDQFAKTGAQFGPFDLVLLENGQYDEGWPYIHMFSEQVIKAGKDLKAQRVFPVHNSKFALANHPWNEPLIRVSEAAEKEQMPLATPKIGEVVQLDNPNQVFSKWWEGLR